MSEAPGIVSRVERGYAYVDIGPRASGCGRCHEPGGCGGGLSVDRGISRTYRLPNRIGARVGDDVVLTIPEGALLKVSLLAYLIPVALVIAGAVVGTIVSDLAAIAGGALGLALGLGLLRLGERKMSSAMERLLAMRIKSCAHHSHEEPRQC